MSNVLELQRGIWIDGQILRRAGMGERWQVLVQPGEIRILPLEGQRTIAWTIPDDAEQAHLLRQIHEEIAPYAAQSQSMALEEEDWEALLG